MTKDQEIELRIKNLEAAVAGHKQVLSGRAETLDLVNKLEALDQSSPPVEILPSELSDRKWMVRSLIQRHSLMHNKHDIRLPGEYTDGEGHTWTYAHFTPASGTWYLWYNTIGEDAYKGYITQEAHLPKIKNRYRKLEICRRPEVVIIPLFSVREDDNEKNKFYIEQWYKDAIYITAESRFAPFQIVAYFVQAIDDAEVKDSPVLNYSCYHPEVTINCASKAVAVDFSEGMKGDWYDLGPFDLLSDGSMSSCVMCDIQGVEEKGDVIDSGEMSNNYSVVWDVSGSLRYSEYAPLPGSGNRVQMFSFPIAGFNAMTISLLQFGYNYMDDEKVAGSAATQKIYKDVLGPFVTRHETLFNYKCTPNAVLDKMQELVSSSELTILQYFGHGSPDHKYAFPEAPWLSAEAVADVINNHAAGRVWLIADCCFSGGHFDHEYDSATMAKSLVDAVVDGVLKAGSGVQLLGWAAAPPDKEGWSRHEGSILSTAIQETFNAGYSYGEQWELVSTRTQGLSTFYKKACNGFDESVQIVH